LIKGDVDIYIKDKDGLSAFHLGLFKNKIKKLKIKYLIIVAKNDKIKKLLKK
jgi:hypothetical protein